MTRHPIWIEALAGFRAPNGIGNPWPPGTLGATAWTFGAGLARLPWPIAWIAGRMLDRWEGR